MTLAFKTPGILEEFSYSMFGVSIKECDSPIGQFGTGLKYAIAITLRLGGEISIWRGLEETRFSVKEELVRGEKISRIYANNEPLPYTTHLGSKWEAWQAFRELQSNTIDEGGESGPLDDLFPEDGATTIVVDCDEIYFAWEERDIIFISPDDEPIATSYEVDIYKGYSPFLYYRGIRVGDAPNGARYRYSLKHESLTEDRTLKSTWSAMHTIGTALKGLNNEGVIKEALRASARGGYESTISWEYGTADKPFLSAASDLIENGVDLDDAIYSEIRNAMPVKDLLELTPSIQLSEKELRTLSTALVRISSIVACPAAEKIIFKDGLPLSRSLISIENTLYVDVSDGVDIDFICSVLVTHGVGEKRHIDPGDHISLINALSQEIMSLLNREV